MKKQADNILEYIKTRKGQFSRASWGRDCKVRKGSPSIRKVTVSTVRSGVDYNSLTAVEAARASGELPETPQPLPWGEWEEFPYTIIHKGVRYLRLYPSPNSNTQVEYFMGDKSVKFEDIQDHLLASEKQSKENLLTFTIKISDLIELY